MITLIAGSLVLSTLHALIPNHWLPVIAIAKKEQWSMAQTTRITLITGLSHALSTVLIGFVIGIAGIELAENVESFTRYIAPAVLVTLGLYYIYQHHRHKHFHVHREISTNSKVIAGLVIAMFFSPCLEIEAYFLLAGAQGWQMLMMLALLYTVVTITGMVLWVRLTFTGLIRFNWHAIEHNAGIITGATLVLTGIISLFIQ
ncbi:MAG: hypothetical protein HYX66_05350 [Ignavibacteria bacterium]|nr:hypothetical protein [Ignavibacteria bacterium]